MMTIFSQEYATAMFEKTTREEALVEGEARGEVKGEAKGKLAQALESAKLMLKAGKLQLSEVLSFFPVLTAQDVEKLRAEVSAA